MVQDQPGGSRDYIRISIGLAPGIVHGCPRTLAMWILQIRNSYEPDEGQASMDADNGSVGIHAKPGNRFRQAVQPTAIDNVAAISGGTPCPYSP